MESPIKGRTVIIDVGAELMIIDKVCWNNYYSQMNSHGTSTVIELPATLQ